MAITEVIKNNLQNITYAGNTYKIGDVMSFFLKWSGTIQGEIVQFGSIVSIDSDMVRSWYVAYIRITACWSDEIIKPVDFGKFEKVDSGIIEENL